MNEQNPLRLSTTEEHVLLTLLGQTRFGLEIRDMLSEASEARCWINFGTLYPILLRLKQRGLIRPSESEADSEKILPIRGKHLRHYYAITDLGRNALLEAELIRQKLRDWEGGLETST